MAAASGGLCVAASGLQSGSVPVRPRVILPQRTTLPGRFRFRRAPSTITARLQAGCSETLNRIHVFPKMFVQNL